MFGPGNGGVPELSLTFDFLLSPACWSKAPGIFCLSCIPPFSILINSSAFWYRPIQLSINIRHADFFPSRESPLLGSGSGRSCKDASVSSKPPAADPRGRPSGWSLGETEALFPHGRALRRKSTRPGCWVAPWLQSRLRARKEWAENESKKDRVKQKETQMYKSFLRA